MSVVYLTLQDLINYGPVNVQGSRDDPVLQSAVDWVNGIFAGLTGSNFDQATMTLATPKRAWMDRNGMLTIVAKERAPVVSVSSIQARIPRVITAWQSIAWDSDSIYLPSQIDPPEPGAWTVSITPSNFNYFPVAADNLYIRWSYTAGYSPLPESLTLFLSRLAWWRYKLREAPLGTIVSPIGTTKIMASIPEDIRVDLLRWTRLMG